MPPFGINPPHPLDFRYPGAFNLNQTPKLPNSFGPPDMASTFQTGISGLADPIVAGMKEAQSRSEARKSGGRRSRGVQDLYASSRTRRRHRQPARQLRDARERTAGSPAGDDTTGAMGGGKLSRDQSRGARQVYEHDEGRRAEQPLRPRGVRGDRAARKRLVERQHQSTWDDLGAPSGGACRGAPGACATCRRSSEALKTLSSRKRCSALKENPALIAR